jgi:HPt (histidine-containing phosphotransfer) domain-containing protein|tara:strand:+ start:182 stop:355 length:174 start_codon:yes stop_codon:yes gene_type:complete
MSNASKTKARIDELKHQARQLRRTAHKLKVEAAMIGLAAKAIEEQADEMDTETKGAV